MRSPKHHAGADVPRKRLHPEPPFVRPAGGGRNRGTPFVPTGSSGHGAQERSRDETACGARRDARPLTASSTVAPPTRDRNEVGNFQPALSGRFQPALTPVSVPQFDCDAVAQEAVDLAVSSHWEHCRAVQAQLDLGLLEGLIRQGRFRRRRATRRRPGRIVSRIDRRPVGFCGPGASCMRFAWFQPRATSRSIAGPSTSAFSLAMVPERDWEGPFEAILGSSLQF
jgi:hypothetical protein